MCNKDRRENKYYYVKSSFQMAVDSHPADINSIRHLKLGGHELQEVSSSRKREKWTCRILDYDSVSVSVWVSVYMMCMCLCVCVCVICMCVCVCMMYMCVSLCICVCVCVCESVCMWRARNRRLRTAYSSLNLTALRTEAPGHTIV